MNLQLKRNPGPNGRLPKWRVMVDGKHVGNIAYDEFATFEISDSAESVQIRTDWQTSAAFNIPSDTRN